MHYAKRMPNIQLAFGLFAKDGDEMIGVCTFGVSSNRHLNDFIEGFPSMEFNRLCIDPEKQEKNLLSWFVSKCLKQIEGPMVIVSYADTAMEHVGYIYQATNWVYTGLSSYVPEFEKDGHVFHSRSLVGQLGTAKRKVMEELGYTLIETKPKHRYIYFIGNKSEVKAMKAKLTWPILPYPKGDGERYEVESQRRKGFFFKV